MSKPDRFAKYRENLPRFCRVKPTEIEVRDPVDEYDFDLYIKMIVPSAIFHRQSRLSGSCEFADIEWLEWIRDWYDPARQGGCDD
jgi:hypothetical protein